jgi:hypothetical protein
VGETGEGGRLTPAQAQKHPASQGARQRLGRLAGLRAAVARGPRGEPTGPSHNSSLSLQRTVERYKASVSRTCWQPAAEARDTRAPTTARVSALLRIAPSGNIVSSQMSGDPPGYRGLARCIEDHLRHWKFPLGSDATTLQVPFVFVAQ